MATDKVYMVRLEQRRIKTVKVSASNLKEARDRALELLEDGALDDGFGLPPDFAAQFKVKVVAIDWKKKRRA